MKNGSESVVHHSTAVSEKERVVYPGKFTVLSLPVQWLRSAVSLADEAVRGMACVYAALAASFVPAAQRIRIKTSPAKYKE